MLKNRLTIDSGKTMDQNGIVSPKRKIDLSVLVEYINPKANKQAIAANHAPRDQVKMMQVITEQKETKQSVFSLPRFVHININKTNGKIKIKYEASTFGFSKKETALLEMFEKYS